MATVITGYNKTGPFVVHYFFIIVAFYFLTNLFRPISPFVSFISQLKTCASRYPLATVSDKISYNFTQPFILGKQREGFNCYSNKVKCKDEEQLRAIRFVDTVFQ